VAAYELELLDVRSLALAPGARVRVAPHLPPAVAIVAHRRRRRRRAAAARERGAKRGGERCLEPLVCFDGKQTTTVFFFRGSCSPSLPLGAAQPSWSTSSARCVGPTIRPVKVYKQRRFSSGSPYEAQ